MKEKKEAIRKLIALKELKNLTYKTLAEFVGVSYDTVKNWLIGRFYPDEDNLIKLNKIFEKEGVK